MCVCVCVCVCVCECVCVCVSLSLTHTQTHIPTLLHRHIPTLFHRNRDSDLVLVKIAWCEKVCRHSRDTDNPITIEEQGAVLRGLVSHQRATEALNEAQPGLQPAEPEGQAGKITSGLAVPQHTVGGKRERG